MDLIWSKRDRKHARVISGAQLEPKDIQKRAETLLMAKDEWLSALALESEADTQDIKTPHMVEYSSCTLTDASPSHIGNISASKDDWFVTLSKQFAF
jgi:hypothetical protein